MSYVVFRSQTDIALGDIKFTTMPRATDGCTYDFVHDNKTLVDEFHENGKSLHNISYLYYTCKKNLFMIYLCQDFQVLI